MIVLDYNEKVSINEVLEVLIGVGTFISTSTLQFQIIAPPPPLNFWIFCHTHLSYLDPLTYQFSRFCFAEISEIDKKDCSFCKTVSSLV